MAQSVQENYKKESFPNSQRYAVLFHIVIIGIDGRVLIGGEKREYFNGDTHLIGYGNNVEEGFSRL